MKEVYRWIIVLGILMVTFGLPVLLQQVIAPKTSKSTKSNAETVTNEVNFVSVPPSLAVTGNKYLYAIDVKTTQGTDAIITIKDKPSWLVWQEESKTLLGVVPTGVHSFTVSLEAKNATGQTATQSFTVTVESPDVKGVNSMQQWEDPFHPPEITITPTPSVSETVSNVSASTAPTAVLGEATTQAIPESERNFYLGTIAVLVFFAGIFMSRLLGLIFTKNKKYFEGVVVQRGRSS